MYEYTPPVGLANTRLRDYSYFLGISLETRRSCLLKFDLTTRIFKGIARSIKNEILKRN